MAIFQFLNRAPVEMRKFLIYQKPKGLVSRPQNWTQKKLRQVWSSYSEIDKFREQK